MPLAFPSTSHGIVAFGFFNVESDMMLLERMFFFCTDFAALVAGIAASGGKRSTEWTLPCWVIERPEDVGDLHAAIRGTGHSGFIGEVYRRFPFPTRAEDFRQNPDGDRARAEMEAIIGRWGRPASLPVVLDDERREIAINGIRFDPTGFQDLVRYVWMGGAPRWRDGKRPSYVVSMRKAVERSTHALLEGLAASAGELAGP